MDGKSEPARLKVELRLEARRRVEGLSAIRARQAAEVVRGRCLELPEIRQAERVFCCLSFGVEIDTWDLVDDLIGLGKEVYVPRAVHTTRQLHLHRFPCPLRTLSFGLKQPKKSAPELPVPEFGTIDVAVLLGLGFDPRGVRLGYGGGFFDRFLASTGLPSIALAYDVQIFDDLPWEAHDVPMDRVLTESRDFKIDRSGHARSDDARSDHARSDDA